MLIRGDIKKIVVLSGMLHNVGDPSLSLAVVIELPLFVRGFFA